MKKIHNHFFAKSMDGNGTRSVCDAGDVAAESHV